jgi:hypothetical protein
VSRRLGRVLLQCLHEATSTAPVPVALAGLGDADLRALPAAANPHGIGPAVHRAVGRAGELPEDAAAQLESSYRRQWQVHLRALADLPLLTGVLAEVGARAVVVKGLVLVEGIYRRVDVRSYVDLDVLVQARDLGVVLEALEGSGASLLDRNWTMIREQVRGELSLQLAHGSALDLHWHLFNEPRVRRAFSLSMDDMLARSRRIDIHGVPTPTLDPADTLIHLAAHAGLGGGHRLVWFKDIEQVIRRDEPDWDEVVRRARSSGLALIVAAMLGRTLRVIGAPVPSEVLRALAPRGWRNAIAVADRISPPQLSFGHKLTARTAVAATRRSGAASTAELARVLWVDAALPLLQHPAATWRRLRAYSDNGEGFGPNPLAYPKGDPTDREAFLRLVAKGEQAR